MNTTTFQKTARTRTSGIRTQMESSPSIATLKVGLPVPIPKWVQDLTAGTAGCFRKKSVRTGLSRFFHFTFNLMIDDYQSSYRQDYFEYQHWPQIGRPEVLIEQGPDTSERALV